MDRFAYDLSRITVNPKVMVGKPTIRGLRITVEQLLKALANGITEDELMTDYPELEKEDFKNYVMVNTILLNYLIKLELFAKAEEELNEKTFVKVSKKNNIFEANREYLLGVFSSKYVTDDTLSAFEHFERAYALNPNDELILAIKNYFDSADSHSR